MKASFRHLGWISLASLALIGCDTAPAPTPNQTAPTPPPAADPREAAQARDAKDKEAKDKNEIKAMPVDKTDNGKLSDEEIAGIKKLPADEQPIAMAQMTCPVSDGKLGGMGMPIKQVVDGKTFYLCCDHCVEDVKKDPTAILAKLKK